MPDKTITLAFTGASGLTYGLRLLECLLSANCQVNLLISQAAQIVAKQEVGLTLPTRPADLEKRLGEICHAASGQLRAYGREDWFAPVASGSAQIDAMVICPCSMGTLAAVAQGMSDNLIERAADVMIKEQRKLVLVPRETPFSVLHLENMLRLARMGALILPANPGFYQKPKNIQDLIDFIVARILDHLGISHDLLPPWGRH
jgi:4-hydroxy-3-polyprenylbenzoate decarboxylase